MEDFELRLRLKELETQVKMQEMHIEFLTSHLSRTDENLKLSIQTPSMQTKCVVANQPRFNPQLKLYETVRMNLEAVSDEKLENLLQAKAPSLPSIIYLLKTALQGEYSNDQQILKVTTNSMCEYLNEKGVVELESSMSVFDNIYTLIYTRCTEIFAKLSKEIENSEQIDETMNDKLTSVYNNSLLLHDHKIKQKVFREITPIIK